MKIKYLFVLLLVLVGCQKPVTDPLDRAATLLPLIRGDEYWRSQAQLAVAAELSRAGRIEKANSLVSEIQGYRRALALLDGVQTQLEAGRFSEAGQVLLSYGSLPREGSAQQSWEIMGRLLSLGEAAGIGKETLAAVEQAGISVPPMFQILGQETFLTAGAADSTVDPLGVEGRKALPGVAKGKDKKKKVDPGKPSAVQEAPEGGGKLQARMKIVSGGSALIIRAKGLLAAGQTEEAKVLLQPALEEGSGYRVGNLAAKADLLRVAWQAGLRDLVNPQLEEMISQTRVQPAALDTAYGYWGQVVRLLATVGRNDEATALALEAPPRIREALTPFFQAQALAELGAGVYQAGLTEQARQLWGEALSVAEKIPNPRSRAWGVLQVCLAAARSGAAFTPEELEKIDRIEKALPEAYAQIGQ
jgi:tetratricopeptide (TPR) repeat protein